VRFSRLTTDFGWNRPWFLRIPVCFHLAVLTLLSSRVQANPTPVTQEVITDLATRAVAQFQMPGLAIALVAEGSPPLFHCAGTMTGSSHKSFDEHTPIPIGSVSKPIFATLLAHYHANGDIDLNAPLPRNAGFRPIERASGLFPSAADILCHRTGLERGDLLWWGRDVTAATMVHRLSKLQTIGDFGTFSYSNVLYAALGEWARAKLGEDWFALLDRDILRPLSMIETRPLAKSLPMFHAATREMIAVGPAASLVSSAADLSKWADSLLRAARADADSVLSPECVALMFAPRVSVPSADAPVPIANGAWSCGLAWFLCDYAGHRFAFHGGSTPESHAVVAVLPDDGFAVVVLANDAEPYGAHSVALTLVDAVIRRATDPPWAATLFSIQKQRTEIEAIRQSGSAVLRESTAPRLPLREASGV